MATPADEDDLLQIAWMQLETRQDMLLVLSEVDTASYFALEDILYSFRWGSEEHKLGIVTALNSPMYSDACKRHFAASHLQDELVFSVAGEFLTEEIILSHVECPTYPIFGLAYFAALMGSEYLSERIVSAAILKIDFFEESKALELIPDRMITPEVMATWQCPASSDGIMGIWRDSPEGKVAAGRRVKQVYSEYKNFPDVWALKVFSGL